LGEYVQVVPNRYLRLGGVKAMRPANSGINFWILVIGDFIAA
jgi:hypothetical protein